MSDVVHEDVLEQILIRSDMKDLIRFKSVCKSWYSLITSSRFISHHLNFSYKKDREDNEHVHRRIVLAHEFTGPYDDNEIHRYLVGSSNGLVCTFSYMFQEILIGNPMTREVRQLKLPGCIRLPSCWGFGYDSSSDDYKVILGTPKGKNSVCFQVWSLKSYVWRVVGEVKYAFIPRRDGVQCNGALHWMVKESDYIKNVILSFDLSKEEFIEIPQPENARYDCTSGTYLGIINECLCIRELPQRCIWVMKKYKVKKSWELLYDHELIYKKDIVHYMRSLQNHNLPESVFHHNLLVHVNAPIFVQSLVSPHVNSWQKREVKRSRSRTKRTSHIEAVKV